MKIQLLRTIIFNHRLETDFDCLDNVLYFLRRDDYFTGQCDVRSPFGIVISFIVLLADTALARILQVLL